MQIAIGGRNAFLHNVPIKWGLITLDANLEMLPHSAKQNKESVVVYYDTPNAEE